MHNRYPLGVVLSKEGGMSEEVNPGTAEAWLICGALKDFWKRCHISKKAKFFSNT